ncbi:hypothetical protein ACQUET_04280 [Lactococcus lactis]|uniref:hypothetical protein n=1 Tax=Lactococcus lactis TaxID=1358 RepID=UPI003D12E362
MNITTIILVLILVYPIFHYIINLVYIEIIPYQVYNFIKNITDTLKRYVRAFSYIFFILLFITIMYIQKKNGLPIFELRNVNLIEISAFSLALLSLYGIYIGFLQYLTEHNEGNSFLGKSKLNFLINSSIWYHITQSRFFFITLLFEVFTPVFIKFNMKMPGLDLYQTNLELSYIWLTTVFILVFLYILLLRMSLEIISITLLMKTGSDLGMQNIIKKEIRGVYERAFWKSYNKPSEYQDLIENMLSKDIKKLAPKDIDDYIVTSFEGIKNEFRLKKRRKFWNDKHIIDLAQFYRKYLQEKWSFLTSEINNISYSAWQSLIIDDISHINFFENKLNEKLSIEKNSPQKLITEYLFDQLLKKSPYNLQDIILYTEKTTNNMDFIIDDKLYKSKVELEKYKWKEIFEIYYIEHSDAQLPNKKTKIYRRTNEMGIAIVESRDYYNTEVSSQACFEFLSRYFGRISEDIDSNKCLKSLIFSMNNEYLISFVLYQMLYTDDGDWGKNFTFFDEILKNILNFCEEEEYEYYFSFAKKTLLHTDISNRITENFLDHLWDTRKISIVNINDWYTKFGQRHRATPFRLLYIQNLFTSPYKNKYTSRVLSQDLCTTEDTELAVQICREFFQLIDNNPKLKENESLSLVIEELLSLADFKYDRLLEYLKLKSLLYFEFIMQYKISYKNKKNYQEIMFGQLEVNYNNETHYLFRSNALLHFFVLKCIQPDYELYFTLVEFTRTLKIELSRFLAKEDLDIHEYIERLYHNLREEEIKISKIEKEMIINKLQSLI